MKPGALTYCPRCGKRFIALIEIEPLEPWETPAPSGTADEIITTCPKCGGETQILELSDEFREALRSDREPPP